MTSEAAITTNNGISHIEASLIKLISIAFIGLGGYALYDFVVALIDGFYVLGLDVFLLPIGFGMLKRYRIAQRLAVIICFFTIIFMIICHFTNWKLQQPALIYFDFHVTLIQYIILHSISLAAYIAITLFLLRKHLSEQFFIYNAYNSNIFVYIVTGLLAAANIGALIVTLLNEAQPPF